MSLDDITAKIRQKMALASNINARVKFDFGSDGALYVDGTQKPPLIATEGDDSALDLTLSCAADTFRAILDGRQDPNIAFMMGRLKVKGSMGLAMKLNAILED